MSRDRSFKSYVADRFYNELYDGIQEFIKDNQHDLDLTLYRVRNIDEIELSDIQVVFVDVHDQPGTGISFDVAVDADTCFLYWSGGCRNLGGNKSGIEEAGGDWFLCRPFFSL